MAGLRFSFPSPAITIVPTQRAAWVVAAAAPAALLIAAVSPAGWLAAPILAGALVALVFLDALLAGRCAAWDVDVPGDAEVGAATPLQVHARFVGDPPSRVRAALEFDPRLAGGGRATIALAQEPDTGAVSGVFAARPAQRGTAELYRAWLRWTGPLGLGARQQVADLDSQVRIWPNLAPVRSPTLQAFLRDAQVGLIARRIRGEGTQFEALSEYEPGMDRRRIDWKASARHNQLYARENESERNNQIVFAFDCGHAMCEPVDGMARLDRAVTAALTCAYVALKGGDRTALFGFARQIELMTPFVQDLRGFHRLQSSAAGLDYNDGEPNFTLALATLTARLNRRSLIVLFSDFSDPTSAELMIESIGRLVTRHLVIFVTIADSELDDYIGREPVDLATLASSVTADSLLRQREIVLQRLRRLGVDVIEAPYEAIGYALIDQYLRIRRSEAVG